MYRCAKVNLKTHSIPFGIVILIIMTDRRKATIKWNQNRIPIIYYDTYILAQISKPPPSLFGNISGILKGTFMKFCINNNESMSCVSVKNIYSNMAI